MLLVPLATGAVVGRPVGDRVVSVLLLAAAALGLFCARTPLEAWLGISPWRAQNPRERRVILHSIYIYTSVSLGALAILLCQIQSYGLFMFIALALAWRKGWLPSLALLAFAPVLWRGLPWFFSSTSRLQIRRLGVGELIHAVIFAALLIVSFHLHV
jgi:hypothetical protein